MSVDSEIRPIIDALNSSGIKTVASCSGHDKMFGNIALGDGRELMILPNFDTARKVERILIDDGIIEPINKKEAE
ncbi:MAG TPA: hypothetical protein ENH82_14760 [bacterium]|nr:hypothetical protein [bacterium]